MINNYIKLQKLSLEAYGKFSSINEQYALLGGNDFPQEVKDKIYANINSLNKEIESINIKIKKVSGNL